MIDKLGTFFHITSMNVPHSFFIVMKNSILWTYPSSLLGMDPGLLGFTSSNTAAESVHIKLCLQTGGRSMWQGAAEAKGLPLSEETKMSPPPF